jgi:hypothetical protein
MIRIFFWIELHLARNGFANEQITVAMCYFVQQTSAYYVLSSDSPPSTANSFSLGAGLFVLKNSIQTYDLLD